MLRRFGSTIRDQWIGTLALFLVLASGTAYAANTVFSTDIVDGQVKTVDLANGAATAAKLADGSITADKILDGSIQGRDVLDNNLKGADIDESTLSNIGGGGPAGGDLIGTYPNPEIAPDTLKGADIDESTLSNIGAGSLKPFVTATDAKLVEGGGIGGMARAQCPFGALAIGGGGGWQYDSGDLSRVNTYGNGTLAVGQNNGGGPQYLYAYVNCLPH